VIVAVDLARCLNNSRTGMEALIEASSFAKNLFKHFQKIGTSALRARMTTRNEITPDRCRLRLRLVVPMYNEEAAVRNFLDSALFGTGTLKSIGFGAIRLSLSQPAMTVYRDSSATGPGAATERRSRVSARLSSPAVLVSASSKSAGVRLKTAKR
jgi:hypothetical protein